MKRFVTTTCLATAFALAGCGSLPDDEGEPSTLVTFSGTVQSTTGALADSGVRVALVWYSGDRHVFAADAEIEAQFPASFSMPVKETPPGDFVQPFDDEPGAPAAAFAKILAYQDLNANGRLDMLELDATEALDRIVGSEANHLVFFLAQSLPPGDLQMADKNGKLPNTGFNILRIDTATLSSDFEWLPANTQLTLTEDESAEAQENMCNGVEGSSGGGPAVNAPEGTIGPDDQYPASDDENLTCDDSSPDEYLYAVETLIGDKPCSKEYTIETTLYSKESGTLPDGWPCTSN